LGNDFNYSAGGSEFESVVWKEELSGAVDC
jgi:hypothetical protein